MPSRDCTESLAAAEAARAHRRSSNLAKPLKCGAFRRFRLRHYTLLVVAALIGSFCRAETAFQITFDPAVSIASSTGRLFLAFSHTNYPEPRVTLGRTGRGQLLGFAMDITNAQPGRSYVFDQTAFGFPLTNIFKLPPGDYFVQSVFDCNRDMRSANAPGNLYSTPEKIRCLSNQRSTVELRLEKAVPAEHLPRETTYVKFVELKSELLSAFHGRPIYLRAGVVLPHSYYFKKPRPFSMWVRIGGLNTRCTTVTKLMKEGSDFQKLWSGKDTPDFLMVQLDGDGPFGDPYYVNSANNGPFGDALVKELIPFIEKQYGGPDYTRARVTSGVSTGGWVALALQIFYPDFFSGAWAACPDPVDFRALEAVNLYEDKSAYTDQEGHERGSERDSEGNVLLTVRQECGAERLLGWRNNFAFSGQQWGEWTAAFSPRGADGAPLPPWNQQTGEIDRKVAHQWEAFDLHLVLGRNWATLAPKLNGKLHIAAAERDQYYLNGAVQLLDNFLKAREPSISARIIYGKDKGHGWSDVSTKEMLTEMQEAVRLR
jgi:Putative esterase